MHPVIPRKLAQFTSVTPGPCGQAPVFCGRAPVQRSGILASVPLPCLQYNGSTMRFNFSRIPLFLNSVGRNPDSLSSLWIVALGCAITASSGCQMMTKSNNGKGVAMYQQGRYAEALQYFEQAKQTDAANPDTYYNLASTYHKLGSAAKDPKMLDNAEAIYNQCLDLAPNHVDCHRGLAVLLVDKGESDKGFALLKNWSARNPGLADARIELARLNQEFNQNKLAEQYLDEALAIDPNNYRAWAFKGQMRESSGELMQAIQNYQQSLALNAKQPELYQRIGALNVRLSQAATTPASTTTR
jgi:Tfp pilus assembly protein PilF